MYKKALPILAACFLLLCSAAFATTRPCPGQFVLTGEWVYLHPIIDSPYYVIPNTSANEEVQDGTRKNVEQCFQSGFRLEGLYGFCDGFTDFRLAWTYLSADDKDSVSGPFLHATQGHPDVHGEDFDSFAGTATSKIDFDFNRVEGVFGFHVFRCGGLSLTLEGGLQYSDFDVTQNTVYFNPPTNTGVVLYDLQYWGIGPQFGLDFNYCFWNCLSFVGNVSGALLVGETDSKFLMTDSLGDADFVDSKNETLWRIVPSTQIRVGLNYQFSCWCNWNLEVGYEFLSYIRALDTVVFPDDIFESLSIDNYSNADMHGPYVSLSLTF